MAGIRTMLFSRIISRNREIYSLKIITLAVAFASTILIILFSLNEFGYDRFHSDTSSIFRVLQKNMDEQYVGNRLTSKIPPAIFEQLKADTYHDSVIVSRVKIMNKVNVLYERKPFYELKVHAADPEIIRIFSFKGLDGKLNDFDNTSDAIVILSSRAALQYTGTIHAAGKKLKLYTFKDTVEVRVAAVFKDFPKNSHEDFDVLLAFNSNAISTLNFDPDEAGVYGRSLITNSKYNLLSPDNFETQSDMSYSLQPLTDIYFGSRVLGEEARHGDRYSVIILICIASLILFLSLTSFVNLTTITLPYRSKELAIKKLAGTSQLHLVFDFLMESATLVSISFFLGLIFLFVTQGFISSLLNIEVLPLIFRLNATLLLIIALLFVLLTVSPVFMTLRFVRATPNRLLSTDTITFPRLKRIVTFMQLGISIFLIIASVVIRRQINYSLVKEPGQNHDQIVYLNVPSGLTNEGIRSLRIGWKKYNPNILDVMAVSQLPDRIVSKEIGSDFYLLQVDAGFNTFFDLQILEGHWFGPNSGDSIIVLNASGQQQMREHQTNVIGVVQDLGSLFNQPEKPVKIKLAQDYNYNWLCVRVLEVDIRRTVNQLSNQFSSGGELAQVSYLNSHFKSWIDYQDKLNRLSDILAVLSALLSCFAIYGLSASLVRDKLKEIAVHKLFGARILRITYLLVREFMKQIIIALIIFGPLTYITLNELLRTFVYATRFQWSDPVYPVAYCVFVIFIICGFQAMSLNRTDFAQALKG